MRLGLGLLVVLETLRIERYGGRLGRTRGEERRLAKGAGGFVVDRGRKRFPGGTDGGDLTGGLEPRVVRASGEAQHGKQGEQQRPGNTDGSHRFEA